MHDYLLYVSFAPIYFRARDGKGEVIAVRANPVRCVSAQRFKISHRLKRALTLISGAHLVRAVECVGEGLGGAEAEYHRKP